MRFGDFCEFCEIRELSQFFTRGWRLQEKCHWSVKSFLRFVLLMASQWEVLIDWVLDDYMSYVVYRSCEGEDHILVSDILRDDRRARGFHLGIRYKPNTPNIRTDSLKLLRKLKKNLIICLYPTTNYSYICILQNNIFPLQNQWKNNQQSVILGHGHK